MSRELAYHTRMTTLTREDIERYHALEEQRKSLQRQADDIGKQAKLIADTMRQIVREYGIQRMFGYVISLKDVSGTPAWKEQFIRVAGLPAAEAIIKDTPKRQQLVVETARDL